YDRPARALPNPAEEFCGLEIGHTFKEIDGIWWIALPGNLTKSRRPDERRVPEWLNSAIDLYLKQSRPVLLRSGSTTNALWISSKTAGTMTTKNLGTLVSKVTLETLGVDVSLICSARLQLLPRQPTEGALPTSPAPY